ncbi:MAG: Mur ligase family protein [Bacteroidota bacterium]|nr:Mur ligase family protein [Bacteroidota bacterium]
MSDIHLIAIGGSVMHNLALALKKLGHRVTGSDDQIFEPARFRLFNQGLLPAEEGWFPERINKNVDFVILGMHAKADNPELLRALELQIPVYSFPQFIAEQYRDKKKVVIAGSHGKTTTTAMLMHVLKELGQQFDYLVGAQLEGFDEMVSISDAPLAIIEGDEYLSSSIDLRPKFMHYNPDICVITGLAWDHYNVFPDYDRYVKAFSDLMTSMDTDSSLIYYADDLDLKETVMEFGDHLQKIKYKEADHVIENNDTYLVYQQHKTPLLIFGNHNLQNIQAVVEVCKLLDFPIEKCYAALSTFKGAAKRLELLESHHGKFVYLDFAHAPSKVRATVQAVRQKFKDKKILVVQELHTYSSLNKEFLPKYEGTLDGSDVAIIYFDKMALEIKRLPQLVPEDIIQAFNNKNIQVVNNREELKRTILGYQNDVEVFLFLGSGNFGGLDLKELTNALLHSS